VTPRHELPGRIVLTIGLITSSLCVVGLIILWLRLWWAQTDSNRRLPACKAGALTS
jgi:hypothetical protein